PARRGETTHLCGRRGRLPLVRKRLGMDRSRSQSRSRLAGGKGTGFPSMKHATGASWNRSLTGAGALVAMLTIVQFTVFSSYLVLKPTPSLRASAIVRSEGGASGSGPFLVSVVAVQRANLVEVLRSIF